MISEYTAAKLKRHLTWAEVTSETVWIYSSLWVVYVGKVFLEKKEKIFKEQQTFKIPFLHVKYIEKIYLKKHDKTEKKMPFWRFLS